MILQKYSYSKNANVHERLHQASRPYSIFYWRKAIRRFRIHKPCPSLKKAKEEYQKYQGTSTTPVEQSYLDTIKDLEKTVKKKSRQ